MSECPYYPSRQPYPETRPPPASGSYCAAGQVEVMESSQCKAETNSGSQRPTDATCQTENPRVCVHHRQAPDERVDNEDQTTDDE
ncbi:hypothetical protein SAMN05216285_0553 [Natrinema salifodinae]|uniref:Uncharacterized protein n=1 Tax=Natrinema salifodinae TaxID=1202768 RepID=A0A1I0M6P9_9EURY|nr:hypothetical protein SAMN05216285_0553 [Natrinema salifodinae]